MKEVCESLRQKIETYNQHLFAGEFKERLFQVHNIFIERVICIELGKIAFFINEHTGKIFVITRCEFAKT